MDENVNQATLRAYENGLKEYNAAAIMTLTGTLKAWIDAGLSMIKPGGFILEIGSAHGRDAVYMESKGFKLFRSDAARSFVDYLRNQGYEARLLNALTDDLGGPYDMIFANAVLLHFTVEQTRQVLRKVKLALQPGGVFAFSVKIGEGASWSHAKLKDPRFFTYWQKEPLKNLLQQAGFTIKYFAEGSTGHDTRDGTRWLHIIACT